MWRRWLLVCSSAVFLAAILRANALGDGPAFSQSDVAVDAQVLNLAEVYERLQTSRFDASGLVDTSPGAVAKRIAIEDELAARLARVDAAHPSPTGSSLQTALHWRLETAKALRPCQSQLWDLDHINGWQATEPQKLAGLHPTTPASQAAALVVALALAPHLDQDVANLRRGLALGYSTPRSVVIRVISEIDALLALPAERSPFFTAGRAANNPDFDSRWRATIQGSVLPAVRRFKSFLQADYLPKARTGIGLSDLPNGRACYAAYLKLSTTLDRSPRQVFELGLRTVAQGQRELSELGTRRFGVGDLASVLKRTDAEPSDHFSSPEALLAFSEGALARTVAMSRPLFEKLPSQSIVVEPLPAYQQDTGIPSHYEAQTEQKAAVFRIDLADWRHETVGAAEVTTSHETVPGHHLQIATARELGAASRFADIAYNVAYVEGWANYAERLAEEAGIYRTDAAKVFRRAVLGRSLVVDPGIHVFGWSRARARTYMMEAGLSGEDANAAIDRIAVQPAQLTAYESGGLEIYELREDARKRLGPRFNLAKFHQRVLERGVVTMRDLDQYVRRWDGS